MTAVTICDFGGPQNKIKGWGGGGFPCSSAGKESTCNVRDLGSIPGLGRSTGEGKGYPLQYFGLENSKDDTVHGVAKIWTRLSGFHFKINSATVIKFPHHFVVKWWDQMPCCWFFECLVFKSAFSLCFFTFIKSLFSSSSLSAFQVVSSAYLRLFIFLPAIWFQLGIQSAWHFMWCPLHIGSISRVTIYSLDVLLS